MSGWSRQECEAGITVFLECEFMCRQVLVYYDGVISGSHREQRVRVCQVRDGRTGSVLFQSEEKPSRVRCTCLCREPRAVVLGQEDGTVQVENPFRHTVRTAYVYGHV